MSVYTSLLFLVQGATSSGSPYSSAAVQPNFVTVLRDISGVIYQGSAGLVIVQLEDPSAHVCDIALFYSDGVTVPTLPFHWEGRQVLQPGWKLRVVVDEGTCDISLCGYNLSNF